MNRLFGSGVAAACVCGVCVAQEPPPAELTAQQIVDRMCTTYAECERYRDTGAVVLTFIPKDRDGHTDTRPFATAFVRPDRFRYQFESNPAPSVPGPMYAYIVWRNDTEIVSWWDVTGERNEYEDLGHALAGPAGVSGGSALLIPSMLMPEMHPSNGLLRLTEPTRLDDEDIDGHACFVVEGVSPTREKCRVWIDTASFLARRVDSTDVMEKQGLAVEHSTRIEPEIDVEIPDETFRREPPAGEG